MRVAPSVALSLPSSPRSRSPQSRPSAAAQHAQPPTQAQQRPVFRGGTHFVRVDAYPAVDGKIVENLKPEDFEILEDGKPQKIESFDFLKFDSSRRMSHAGSVVAARGFRHGGGPALSRVRHLSSTWRSSTSPGAGGAERRSAAIQPAARELPRSHLGTEDLFGFLTSRNSVKDLVLAQKTTSPSRRRSTCAARR